jgi:hypothetical protein
LSSDRSQKRIAYVALLSPKLVKLLGASPQRDLVADVHGSLSRCQTDSGAASNPFAADEFGDGSLVFALGHFRLTLNSGARSSCEAAMIPNGWASRNPVFSLGKLRMHGLPRQILPAAEIIGWTSSALDANHWLERGDFA